eukprot:4796892-Pleurochrysis_carterae.AAC.1
MRLERRTAAGTGAARRDLHWGLRPGRGGAGDERTAADAAPAAWRTRPHSSVAGGVGAAGG